MNLHEKVARKLQLASDRHYQSLLHIMRILSRA